MKFVSGVFVLLLSLMAAAPLQASDDIELHSFEVSRRGGEFLFSARVSVPVDEEVRSALATGVVIYLRLQAVVERKSKYWFDEGVRDLRVQRELSWSALSERYVLRYESRKGEAGRQQTFSTLEDALVAAGVVDNWPIIAEDELDPGSTYEFSMRAGLRRGRMPSTLKDLTFWTRYWNHRSEWQSWTLRR